MKQTTSRLMSIFFFLLVTTIGFGVVFDDEDSGNAKSILVLNPQSYPTIYKNWTIDFVTEGSAPIEFSAIKETDYHIDLHYVSLYCGDEKISPELIYEDGKLISVTVANWTCDTIGYYTVSPQTEGKHHQQIQFANFITYADNLVPTISEVAITSTESGISTTADSPRLNYSLFTIGVTASASGDPVNCSYHIMNQTVLPGHRCTTAYPTPNSIAGWNYNLASTEQNATCGGELGQDFTSLEVGPLIDGTYDYGFFCVLNDVPGNESAVQRTITIDTQCSLPQVISPVNNTLLDNRSFSITLNTTEQSTCRWSTTESGFYGMPSANEFSGVVPSTVITINETGTPGVGTAQPVYFSCIDDLGNVLSSEGNSCSNATQVYVYDYPQPATNFSGIDTPGDQGESITLSWTASTDDGAGEDDVVYYHITRAAGTDGWSFLANVTASDAATYTYFDTVGVNTTSNYSYRISAWDSFANSTNLSLSNINSTDNTAPAAVTNFRVIDNPGDQGGHIILSWNLSTDDPLVNASGDVVNYTIFRTLLSGVYNTSNPWANVSSGTSLFDDFNVSSVNGTYYYFVRAYDSAGRFADSAEVFNTTNAQPFFEWINVTPENATTVDDIVCTALGRDDDNESLSMTYNMTVLHRNGSATYYNGNASCIFVGTQFFEQIGANVSNATECVAGISSSLTQKADKIRCEMQAYDGQEYSVLTQSNIVFINNTGPSAENVSILPTIANGSSNLFCNYSYFDPYDGDPENTTLKTFKWYINNEGLNNFIEIPSQIGQWLPNNLIDQNDQVICAVRTHDSDNSYLENPLPSAAYVNSTIRVISENSIPQVVNLQDDSNSTHPTTVGDAVNFNITWLDTDLYSGGENVQVFACDAFATSENQYALATGNVTFGDTAADGDLEVWFYGNETGQYASTIAIRPYRIGRSGLTTLIGDTIVQAGDPDVGLNLSCFRNINDAQEGIRNETYYDADFSNRYTEGEPIIYDNGNLIYEAALDTILAGYAPPSGASLIKLTDINHTYVSYTQLGDDYASGDAIYQNLTNNVTGQDACNANATVQPGLRRLTTYSQDELNLKTTAPIYDMIVFEVDALGERPNPTTQNVIARDNNLIFTAGEYTIFNPEYNAQPLPNKYLAFKLCIDANDDDICDSNENALSDNISIYANASYPGGYLVTDYSGSNRSNPDITINWESPNPIICDSQLYCNTTLSSDTTQMCSYTARQEDNFTTHYQVRACDDEDACSIVRTGEFYVNHIAAMNGVTIVSDSPNAIIGDDSNLECIHFGANDESDSNIDILIDADGNATRFGNVNNANDTGLLDGVALLAINETNVYNSTGVVNLTFDSNILVDAVNQTVTGFIYGKTALVIDNDNDGVFNSSVDTVLHNPTPNLFEGDALVSVSSSTTSTFAEVGGINFSGSRLAFYDRNGDGNYSWYNGEDLIIELNTTTSNPNNRFDKDITYEYTWFVKPNGTTNFSECTDFAFCTNDHNAILTHGNTNQGDEWICQVKPIDPFMNGTAYNTSSYAIGSSGADPTLSPTILSIVDNSHHTYGFDDSAISIGSVLNINISWTDPDSTEIIAYVCNSTSIIRNSGCLEYELARNVTSENPAIVYHTVEDIWPYNHGMVNYTVQICDQEFHCSDIWQTNSSMNISFYPNSVPLVTNINISSIDNNNGNPLNYTDEANLYCNVTVADNDSIDTASVYRYQWFRNRTGNYELLFSTNNATLSHTNTLDGDRFICSASAQDNFTIGPSKNSTAIVIGTVGTAVNVAPRIINVTTNSNITHPTNLGENFTFTIHWEDGDSNLVTFFLCNDSSITPTGCLGTEFGSVTTSANPAILNYTITESDLTSFANASPYGFDLDYVIRVYDDAFNFSTYTTNTTDDRDNLSVNWLPAAENLTVNTTNSTQYVRCTYDFVDTRNTTQTPGTNVSSIYYTEGTSTIHWYQYNTSTSVFDLLPFTGSQLSASSYLVGDQLICQVTPHDGYANGTILNSSSITVGSPAPQVIDVTVTFNGTNGTLTNAMNTPATKSQNVTFLVDWFDPDQLLGGENVSLYVCNSSNSISSGCLETTYCSAGPSGTDPLSCSFNTSSLNFSSILNGTFNYSVILYDSTTSVSSAYTSQFFVNIIPEIASAAITGTPSPILNTSDLSCQYTLESDNENGSFYTQDLHTFVWYRNNGTNFTAVPGVTGPFVSSLQTQNAEQWICQITPYDGYGMGTSINTSAITIGTTSPLISSVEVYSLSNTTVVTNTNTTPNTYGELLSVNVSWVDGTYLENITLFICDNESAANTACINATYCTAGPTNTNPVSCTFNTSLISESVVNFSNNSVNLSFTLFDTSSQSSLNYTQLVYIDRPPVVTNISIVPSSGNDFFDTTNLNCQVNISDPDFDTFLYNVSSPPLTYYTWYRNNGSGYMPHSLTVPNVSNGQTELNDLWICQATPSDGYVNGTATNSSAILIVNESSTLVPSFTSIQINQNVSTSDSLTFTAPNGTTIITDGVSTNVGDAITFTVDWIDSDQISSEQVQLYVCNSTAIQNNSGCLDRIINETAFTSDDPIVVTYHPSDFDFSLQNVSFMLCDDSGRCSDREIWNFTVNHRPTVSSVNVSPSIAGVDQDLTCTYAYQSSDNGNVSDAENNVSTQYQWYVNTSGSFVLQNVTDRTLPGAFAVGDRVLCGVQVFDIQGLSDTNYQNSSSITILDLPTAPILWNVPAVISNSTTNATRYNFVGYLNRTNVSIQGRTLQNFNIPKTNFSAVQNNASSITGISFLQSARTTSDSFIVINDTGEAGFAVGNYVEFVSHNRTYFERYEIINKIFIFNNVWRIELNSTLEDNVSSGELVYAYNTSGQYPSGWFNMSLELFNGSNTVYLNGNTSTTNGTYEIVDLFVDTKIPTINGSNITNFSVLSPTLSFSIADDYATQNGSLLVNVSNSSHQFFFFTNDTLYNTTYYDTLGTINTTITCVPSQFNHSQCSATIGVPSKGDYVIAITVNDTVNHTATLLLNSTIDEDIPTTPMIFAASEQNTTNLTAGIGMQLGSVYQIQFAIGTAGYPNTGWNTTLALTNLSVANFSTLTHFIDAEYNGYFDGSDIIVNTSDTYLNASDNITTSGSGSLIRSFKSGTEMFNDSNSDGIFDPTTDIIVYTKDLDGVYNVSNDTVLYPINGTLTDLSTLTDMASLFKYVDNNNDGNYSLGEAILRTTNSALDSTLLNGSGTDNVSVNGSANIRTLINTTEYDLNLTDGEVYRISVRYKTLEDGVFSTFGVSTPILYNQPFDSPVFLGPSSVSVFDTGDISATYQLFANWTESIPQNQSAGESILWYEYQLGTAPYPYPGWNNTISSWTSTGLTREVNITTNLNLTQGAAYYFTVRSLSSFGLYSNPNSSDGIVYNDQMPPVLTLVSVANDTSSSGGWLDPQDDSSTMINFTSDENLSHCVFSTFDIPYTLTPGIQQSCNGISASDKRSVTCNATTMSSTPLSQGNHTFYVACLDESGNANNVSNNYALDFVIDFPDAPFVNNITVLVYNSSNSSTNRTYLFNDDNLVCNWTYFDQDGDSLNTSATSYAWQLEGANISGETTSLLNLSSYGLSRGDNVSCSVVIADVTGRYTSNMSSNVTVNNSQPSSPAQTAPANETYHSQSATFTWTSSLDTDPSDSLVYFLHIANGTSVYDSNALGVTTLAVNLTSPLLYSDGAYTWNVEACDNSTNEGTYGNNCSTSSLNYTFNVDQTGPAITIVSPDNSSTMSTDFTIIATINDSNQPYVNVSTQTYTISNATHTVASGSLTLSSGSYTAAISLPNISNGNYNLTITAVDTLGNTNSEIMYLSLDTGVPTIQIDNHPFTFREQFLNSSFTLNLTVYSANYSSYELISSNGTVVQTNSTSSNASMDFANFTFNDTVDLSDLDTFPDGVYTINFSAGNVIGAYVEQTSYFGVDRMPPYFTNAVATPDPVFQNSNVTLSVTWLNNSFVVGDNRFGIADVWFYVQATNGSTTLTDVFSLANGEVNVSGDTYSVSVKDLNSSLINYSFPNVTWWSDAIDFAGNSNTTNGTINLNFSVQNNAPVFNATISDLIWPEDTVNDTVYLNITHFIDYEDDPLSFSALVLPKGTLLYDTLDHESETEVFGGSSANTSFALGSFKNATLIEGASYNLLLNPSFEENTTYIDGNFSAPAPASWVYVNLPNYSTTSQYSFPLHTGESAGVNVSAKHYFYQEVNVSSSTAYVLSEYIRSAGATATARLHINWYDSSYYTDTTPDKSGSFISTTLDPGNSSDPARPTVTSTFARYSLNVTSPSTASVARIFADSDDNDTFVFVDNVQFEQSTNVSSFMRSNTSSGYVRYPITWNMSGRPRLNTSFGTLSFFITPQWDGNDDRIRTLVDASGADTFRLRKNALGLLEFTFDGQTITTDISSWTRNSTQYVTLTWNTTADRMQIYVNGTSMTNGSASISAPTLGSNLYLGSSVNQDLEGHAYFDEFIVYDYVKSAAFILNDSSTLPIYTGSQINWSINNNTLASNYSQALLTPAGNFSGEERIQFFATDDSRRAASNIINMFVTPVNDAPGYDSGAVFGGNSYGPLVPNPLTIVEGSTRSQVYNLDDHFYDIEGDMLNYSANTSDGSISVLLTQEYKNLLTNSEFITNVSGGIGTAWSNYTNGSVGTIVYAINTTSVLSGNSSQNIRFTNVDNATEILLLTQGINSTRNYTTYRFGIITNFTNTNSSAIRYFLRAREHNATANMTSSSWELTNLSNTFVARNYTTTLNGSRINLSLDFYAQVLGNDVNTSILVDNATLSRNGTWVNITASSDSFISAPQPVIVNFLASDTNDTTMSENLNVTILSVNQNNTIINSSINDTFYPNNNTNEVPGVNYSIIMNSTINYTTAYFNSISSLINLSRINFTYMNNTQVSRANITNSSINTSNLSFTSMRIVHLSNITGSNLSGSTTVYNSTLNFSTFVSALSYSSVFNWSTVTSSTVDNSTSYNSTIALSWVNASSTLIDSNISNSTIISSTLTNVTALDTTLENVIIEDTFIDPSNFTNSNITGGSTILDSNGTWSWVHNSSVNISYLEYTRVNQSIVNRSTLLNSSFLNSTVLNSTLTRVSINQSTIANCGFTDINGTNVSMTSNSTCNCSVTSNANRNGFVVTNAGRWNFTGTDMLCLSDLVNSAPTVTIVNPTNNTIISLSGATTYAMDLNATIVDPDIAGGLFNDSITDYLWNITNGSTTVTRTGQNNDSYTFLGLTENMYSYNITFTVTDSRGLTGTDLVMIEFQAGNCTDGLQNGDETGADVGGRCGGGSSPSPGSSGGGGGGGSGFGVPAYCHNGEWDSGEVGYDCGSVCKISCELICKNGIQDGNENGVDCGGQCGRECARATTPIPHTPSTPSTPTETEPSQEPTPLPQPPVETTPPVTEEPQEFDESSSLSWLWFFLIFVILLGLGVAAILLRRDKEETVIIEAEKDPLPDDDVMPVVGGAMDLPATTVLPSSETNNALLELEKYIIHHVNEGMAAEDILSTISAAGWSPVVAEVVLNKIHLSEDHLDELETYIEKQFLKNKSQSEVRASLVAKNWSPEIVDVVMHDVHNVDEDISKVKSYIANKHAQNLSFDEISQMLVHYGWDEGIIDALLEERMREQNGGVGTQ